MDICIYVDMAVSVSWGAPLKRFHVAFGFMQGRFRVDMIRGPVWLLRGWYMAVSKSWRVL